jgi:hypothetical protein
MEKVNLLESYKGRLSISEKYFAQKNNGAKMGNTKKMLTAQCLENTAKYLNEAFEMSVGTQRSDIGTFKKFCLDITTLTMPNLIVNDLFIVQPMSSFSGYLTYLQYGLGEAKGGAGGVDAEGNLNTVTQDPFVWSAMTEDRAKYTGEAVVETITTEGQVSWTPVVGDVEKKNGEKWEKVEVADLVVGDVVRYHYNNQVVPQAKLPTMVGKMKGIALQARARRIAVNYSQFAAFQS